MPSDTQGWLQFAAETFLWTFFQRAAAITPEAITNGSSVCRINLGEVSLSTPFNFATWLSRGQCVRNVTSYVQCRDRLAQVLTFDIDTLHQLEYSASASVLTLLPTIGALFGNPTSEVWALFKIFPPAGVLALTLSFGGTLFPSRSEDYVSLMKKQGLRAFRFDETVQKLPSSKIGADAGSPVEFFHGQIDDMMKHDSDHVRLQAFSATTVLGLGLFSLFILFSAVMSAMAILEQGAVYATLCTSIWWMHLWYLIVTLVAMVEAWILLPFTEKCKIYLTHDHQVPEIHHSRSHTMLIVISVNSENEHQPWWVTSLRLFLRAGGLIIYIFGTTVFASIALMALPPAQMVLVLIMGGGLFGRAITSGLVSIISERSPIMHVILDKETDVNVVRDRITDYYDYQRVQGDVRLLMEVDGVMHVPGEPVGRRKPWPRRCFGVFAR